MAKKMTEREQFYYGKGYAQGKIDFAKEVMERIGCIETCYGDDYDMGVDWAVCEALKIINEMVGGSDGRE
jgi:hypothetical protein